MCDYDDEQSTVFTRHITGEEQAAESHRSSTATVKPVKYNFKFSILNLNSEEKFSFPAGATPRQSIDKNHCVTNKQVR